MRLASFWQCVPRTPICKVYIHLQDFCACVVSPTSAIRRRYVPFLDETLIRKASFNFAFASVAPRFLSFLFVFRLMCMYSGMLENLCLADLGYTPASLDYAMTHDRAAWRKNVPDLPVHVIPIMETAFFDVVAFVMPPGSRFEMHDHMGMGTDDNDAPEEAQPRTVANLKFAEEQEGDGWIARVMFDGRLHSSLPHPPKTLALLSSISEEACDLLPCSRFPTSWAALPCLFNGHMIEAETTCVLFDVLSPPYLLHSGRPCRFFSLLGRPDERGCDEPTVPRHPEADIGSGDADAADASDASGNEVWWHVSFPPELVTIPYMSQLSFGAHSPSEIACEAE
eukprot:GHVT01048679.1.p1 GENE.GHVT01048679.1~~GHVT01048679.1.p1  ORF type:complete len:339 (+),score=41.51 GHVT01048679.1:1117-2133(+)